VNYNCLTVYYLNIYNVIYTCGGKDEFSASLIQSFVSRDPSEINILW